jgi:hypothetical protein
MRLFCALSLSLLLAASAVSIHAQVVPSATARQLSLTAGGMVSLFQPDFEGGWTYPNSSGVEYPVAQASNQGLFGVGAYVDVKLSHWVQIEAEGRRLRFNQYEGIYQDNYLIGPRLPVYHFWKATVYGKALYGISKMNFDPQGDHGTFSTIAFGGGMDVQLTKKISFRAVDIEYQDWPAWGNSTIKPYGVSMGVGYKFF